MTTTPRAWWGAALAVAAVGWGANQFVPLLLLYRDRLDLSTATLQALFGLYALGLVPGLLLGGPISDRHGRRRVALLALATSLLATTLLSAGTCGGLYAGRLIAGVASGAAFASGAAWIKELSAAGSPTGARRGPRRATVAMTVGFAAGPLVAGVLAQWAPAPTVVPYLPHLALTAAAIGAALRTPEIRHARPAGGLWRQLRPTGTHDHRFRTVVLPLAPWVFASASIALSYLPGLVADRVAGHAVVFSAGNAGLTAGAGIAVQPLARRLEQAGAGRPIRVSLTLVALGVLAAATAAASTEPALVLAAAAVLGAGYGCCQVAGFAEVQRIAAADELAGLTAVYQAVTYLGFAVPFVLAAAEPVLAPGRSLSILAALAAGTLWWTSRRAARARPDQGSPIGALRGPEH
ncbi:MFS transporter [Embleya scabrispora]|uniref:MFS transporter n=1 Tax=Embleya scabrispora TaxID=159449 RepID=UPI001F3B9C85|nr:MFS transporter [Embleya scabrispora]